MCHAGRIHIFPLFTVSFHCILVNVMNNLHCLGLNKKLLRFTYTKSLNTPLRTYIVLNLHLIVLKVATGIHIETNVGKVGQWRPSSNYSHKEDSHSISLQWVPIRVEPLISQPHRSRGDIPKYNSLDAGIYGTVGIWKFQFKWQFYNFTMNT